MHHNAAAGDEFGANFVDYLEQQVRLSFWIDRSNSPHQVTKSTCKQNAQWRRIVYGTAMRQTNDGANPCRL